VQHNLQSFYHGEENTRLWPLLTPRPHIIIDRGTDHLWPRPNTRNYNSITDDNGHDVRARA